MQKKLWDSFCWTGTVYFSGGVLVEQLADHMRNEYINMNAQEPEKKARRKKLEKCSRHDIPVELRALPYIGVLPTFILVFSPSLSDTCEIRVLQLVCERRDICYYAFQRVVVADLFAGFGK